MFFYSKTTGGFFHSDINDSMPDDAVEISDSRHAELMAAQFSGQQIVSDEDGRPVAVQSQPPTPQERQRALTSAVQAHLDEAAQALGYDDIRSAITYADEPAVAKFQAEGRALRAWRSKVWEHCWAVQAQFESGKAEEPTAASLIAGLPKLVM